VRAAPLDDPEHHLFDLLGRLARRLPLAAVALAAAGALVAAAAAPLQRSALGRSLLAWLHLDGEGTVAAWLGSSMLLLCALLAAWLARRAAPPDARAWRTLAFLYAAMSMDETIGMHERLGNQVARTLELEALGTFAWLLPGAALLLAAIALFARFVRRQEAALRRRLLAAHLCYFGGALGCEAAGAWLHAHSGRESAAYEASVVAEEGLELFGAALLFGVLTAAVGPTTRSGVATATEAALGQAPPRASAGPGAS
jgi:hypothetical protein